MKHLIISFVAIVIGIFLGLVLLVPREKTDVLSGYIPQNQYDTTSAGFTQATKTINVAATQVFASVEIVSEIINNTTSTFTCALEASNTTAASSSVVSGRGVLIGTNAGTVIPSVVAFGNCDNLGKACYRHKGAVNCVANVTATITTNVQ